MPFRSAREAWRGPGLDGAVYGSPIVAGGLVMVATEHDSLYAFDAASGEQRWKRTLGQPVDSSSLPCGDISPEAGITSTPVADVSSSRVHVVAFQQPGQHVLYTLDLRSGEVVDHQPVDPPGESPLTEQQRGALKLVNGTVLIPYGGLFGDCGRYHGWVVGVRLRDGARLGWRPGSCPKECGLWAPGGPTVGPDGDVWVATGNSDGSTGAFDGGNAVFRLSSSLQQRDWFAPDDWRQLSGTDTDLGSISPILLSGGLAWISGKGATGYLLRQDHLGHVGGQAFSGSACASFGSGLASGPALYVSCLDPSRVQAIAVRTDGPSFAGGWHRDLGRPGGLILAFGAIWVMDGDGGVLEALDPRTGDVRFSLDGGAAEHFATPAAASGHVYAVMGRRLLAVSTA
jgi:outer membrane protein assembly factor BamB